MPALMGRDSAHPRSLGEVGREGVAVDTVLDMETLFRGIPLDEVTVSMTINAPAAIMLAFSVVAAERQGISSERLGGTIQTDILKEYIAQKEWCFPVDPAMRLVTDMVEWCSRHMPSWHPISISGYHIREAGATAAQELAFTLKAGLTYVEHAIERGLDVDEFAPRLSFFFNAQIDFFEEIATYRAARRIWARELRETFGARNPRSLLMRFHTQTAGAPSRPYGSPSGPSRSSPTRPGSPARNRRCRIRPSARGRRRRPHRRRSQRVTEGDDAEMPILRVDPALERKQITRLKTARAGRDSASVERVVAALRSAGAGSTNLMPLLVDAARVHATEGEIVQALQEVWGDYREQPVF